MNSTEKVILPNVYLFAFHFDDAENSNNHFLESKCNQILEKLEIKQTLKTHNNIEIGSRIDLLETEKEETDKEDEKNDLPISGKLRQNNREVDGLVYPLWLYDSYGLVFNIGIADIEIAEHEENPETNLVSLDNFKYLNPDRCFLNIKSELRQVIILTAKLTDEQLNKNETYWQKIANQCVESFCQKPLRECPPFYQDKDKDNKLFGSPIFEYGDPKNSHEDNYIMVWLFANNETEANFQGCFQEMIDLLFYRQKVIRTYEDSQDIYQQLKQKYQESKTIFNELDKKITSYLNQTGESKQHLSDLKLNDLQKQLTLLPNLAFSYTNYIRDLENRLLNIKTNTDNYKIRATKISQSNTPQDLTYLSFFSDTISKTMQEQIKEYLGYAENNLGVFDKAIAPIHSIVEIEQTKRDRSLEKTIKILGVAVGTGGIVASGITGHITTPISWKPTGKLETLHPAVSTLLISFIFAFIAGWIAWFITRKE